MRGRGPFEGAKNENTPDSNLMICPAGVAGGAIFMRNIAGTLVVCQGARQADVRTRMTFILKLQIQAFR